MTLTQAQMVIDAGQLTPEQGEAWELRWAKFTLKHREQLMARACSSRARRVIAARCERFTPIVLAALLSES